MNELTESVLGDKTILGSRRNRQAKQNKTKTRL